MAETSKGKTKLNVKVVLIVEFLFYAKCKLREIVQTRLTDLYLSRYEAVFFLLVLNPHIGMQRVQEFFCE